MCVFDARPTGTSSLFSFVYTVLYVVVVLTANIITSNKNETIRHVIITAIDGHENIVKFCNELLNAIPSYYYFT